MTTFGQQGTAQRAVSATYLRDNIGLAQDHTVTCHFGTYAGQLYEFHSHANNAQQALPNWYVVSRFTVTARPAAGGIGHAGFHVNCTRQPNGTWVKNFDNGIPQDIQAALDQLADEIIEDLTEEQDDSAAAFNRELRRKRDDEDKGKKRLLRMGLKVPTTGSAK